MLQPSLCFLQRLSRSLCFLQPFSLLSSTIKTSLSAFFNKYSSISHSLLLPLQSDAPWRLLPASHDSDGAHDCQGEVREGEVVRDESSVHLELRDGDSPLSSECLCRQRSPKCCEAKTGDSPLSSEVRSGGRKFRSGGREFRSVSQDKWVMLWFDPNQALVSALVGVCADGKRKQFWAQALWTRLHKDISKGEEDDEEDELPMAKGNKKWGKPQLRKSIAKGEEEEDDDDEFTPDEVDGADEDEDELPMTKRNKKVGKSRLHKGIAKGEEEEDDDAEFTPDEVDGADEDEDELPMTKRNKKVGKSRLHKGISKGEENDDVGFASNEVDEVDGVDEEDELPMAMGYGKLGKSRKLHKGIAKGEQSKTTSKVSKKIKRGKSRNKCGVKKKERVDEKGKINDMSSLEAKNKITVEGRRNKRLIVHSDSDSVSSGPLDYEYTISEEEREQVREATEFCGGLTASWRCPAISKNLMEKETPRVQKKRSRRKDKEKVEEWKTEAGKQVCGICLSEEGKRRVRGTLNCCSHYFCFACIMEWSKVESRCPLCKQRFVTISKPAKSNTGFDLRTVVIPVPERDQVYQPSEEELRGYLDPYENVICTECQQGGDDALMLLCDLCDSPAHTYCVGLGHEVPEGNWYCEGCRPTALGTQQNLNLTPENRSSNNFSVGSSPVTNVRETFDLNEMYVPEAPLTQEACHVPSPRIGQAALLASGSVASTVFDRRRIQRQIHQILINNGRIMRQIDNRTTGAMTSVTGNYLFGSQIGQIRELAPQPVVAALERAPHTVLHGRRLQENMNAFAESPSHLNEQSIQNQPSTSVQSSFSGLFQGEFGAINSDIGSGLVHQQIHPCSSRPNIVPDASTSPYQFREVSPFNIEKNQQIKSFV
nr:ABC transporter F family member 4-like [Ipomoea batatas]